MINILVPIGTFVVGFSLGYFISYRYSFKIDFKSYFLCKRSNDVIVKKIYDVLKSTQASLTVIGLTNFREQIIQDTARLIVMQEPQFANVDYETLYESIKNKIDKDSAVDNMVNNTFKKLEKEYAKNGDKNTEMYSVVDEINNDGHFEDGLKLSSEIDWNSDMKSSNPFNDGEGFNVGGFLNDGK